MEHVDSLLRLLVDQRNLRPGCGKPVRLHHGVIREALLQILHQGFCPLSIATAGQYQGPELLSFGTVGRYVHRVKVLVTVNFRGCPSSIRSKFRWADMPKPTVSINLGRAGAYSLDLVSFQPIQFPLLLHLLIFQLCSFPGNVKRIHLVGISGYLAVLDAVQNLQCHLVQLLR